MEKKNPILSIVVLLVIVAAAVGVLFMLFKPADLANTNNKDSNLKTTEVPGVENSDVPNAEDANVTATPAVTVKPSTIATPAVTAAAGCDVVAAVTAAAVPGNWVKIDNGALVSYDVYRAKGFNYRVFTNDFVGIDPNPIPSASEYAGIISVMKLSGANNFDSQLANLEPGYQKCTREIDARTWTTVVGKTKANEISSSNFIKYAKVTVNAKDYMAKLTSTAADYSGQANNFETFITILKFK